MGLQKEGYPSSWVYFKNTLISADCALMMASASPSPLRRLPGVPEPSTHQAPAGADGHVGAAGLALQVARVEAVGPGGPLPGQAFSSPVLHGYVPRQEARAVGQV